MSRSNWNPDPKGKAGLRPLTCAVIMAGGKGKRFWPRSRKARPKQILAIGTQKPMVQETVQRLLPLLPPERIFISCGRDLFQSIAKILPGIPRENFVLEPVGRNTAPSVGLALEKIKRAWGRPEREVVVAVLPADHWIRRPARFRGILQQAIKAAERSERIVTLGIVPDRLSSAYGYLQPGPRLPGETHARALKRFVEKPEPKTAGQYVRRGFLWNAGIFIFRLDVMQRAYLDFLPKMARGLARIGSRLGQRDYHRVLDREFPKLQDLSLDYGIMEKAKNLAVIRADFGWRDVGGWDALYRLLGGDGTNNVAAGPAEFLKAKGCYVESRRLFGLVGVEDLAVIETEDAVLILNRGQEGDLKKLVDRLEAKGLARLL